MKKADLRFQVKECLEKVIDHTHIMRRAISGCRSSGRGKNGAIDEYRGSTSSYPMNIISDTPEPAKQPIMVGLDQPCPSPMDEALCKA
jgi:hypothetical protein